MVRAYKPYLFGDPEPAGGNQHSNSYTSDAKTCAFPGCPKPRKKGYPLCSGHRKQKQRGKVLAPLGAHRQKIQQDHCTWPGCKVLRVKAYTKKHGKYSSRYCPTHLYQYQKERRHGPRQPATED